METLQYQSLINSNILEDSKYSKTNFKWRLSSKDYHNTLTSTTARIFKSNRMVPDVDKVMGEKRYIRKNLSLDTGTLQNQLKTLQGSFSPEFFSKSKTQCKPDTMNTFNLSYKNFKKGHMNSHQRDPSKTSCFNEFPKVDMTNAEHNQFFMNDEKIIEKINISAKNKTELFKSEPTQRENYPKNIEKSYKATNIFCNPIQIGIQSDRRIHFELDKNKKDFSPIHFKETLFPNEGAGTTKYNMSTSQQRRNSSRVPNSNKSLYGAKYSELLKNRPKELLNLFTSVEIQHLKAVDVEKEKIMNNMSQGIKAKALKKDQKDKIKMLHNDMKTSEENLLKNKRLEVEPVPVVRNTRQRSESIVKSPFRHDFVIENVMEEASDLG